MKVVIQRVLQAQVRVANQCVGKIKKGYVLFVGIEKEDNEMEIEKMAKKIVNLRINADEKGKTNLSILDTKGEILSVSQFTLCADVDSRRPSFSKAADANTAKKLYDLLNSTLLSFPIHVETGRFQEHMEVSLINDGPFTILLDSKNK